MIITDDIVVAAGYKDGVDEALWADASPTISRYVRLLLRAGMVLTAKEAVALDWKTIAVIIAEREAMIEEAFEPDPPEAESEDSRIARVLSENESAIREEYDNLTFRVN